jgi:hypothetical protein
VGLCSVELVQVVRMVRWSSVSVRGSVPVVCRAVSHILNQFGAHHAKTVSRAGTITIEPLVVQFILRVDRPLFFQGRI